MKKRMIDLDKATVTVSTSTGDIFITQIDNDGATFGERKVVTGAAVKAVAMLAAQADCEQIYMESPDNSDMFKLKLTEVEDDEKENLKKLRG